MVIDLYRNATGELAHYALPCADMLERRDVNLVGLGLQHQPFVQYTEAVVPPRDERREEWWILARLEQAAHCDLNEEQQMLFELHHLENQSIRDIAVRMRKSVDSIKSSLYRTRRLLPAR